MPVASAGGTLVPRLEWKRGPCRERKQRPWQRTGNIDVRFTTKKGLN